MKQWNIALQCRAQSSQAKALHSAGLAAIGRDSFAHGLETVGGVMTSSSSVTPPSPPRREFCAESKSNKAEIEAKNCLRSIFHYARTLNEDICRTNAKMATKERSRLQCRRHWVVRRLPSRLILFSKTSTIRARCLEHSSRSVALTTL